MGAQDSFRCFNWSMFFPQAVVGQTQSWPTLSSWWSWAPQWSRPPLPARFEHPTFPMRSSGATSSRPSSPCPHQENTWRILPFLTRWPKPKPHLFSSRHCLRVLHRRHPAAMVARRMGWTRRRCAWRRATEGRRGGENGGGSEIAALWVFVLAMFEAAGCEGKKKLEQKNTFWRLYIPHAFPVNCETQHLAACEQQPHILLFLTTHLLTACWRCLQTNFKRDKSKNQLKILSENSTLCQPFMTYIQFSYLISCKHWHSFTFWG